MQIVLGLDRVRRAPGKTWRQALGWDIAVTVAECTLRTFFLYRIEGAHRVPRSGPLLFVSNHESYLDPVVNGVACKDRQAGYLAKESLFVGPFGRLIRALGAIPLKERSDMGAIRAAITELQAGRCVIVYPEGGRSEDGSVGPFQRGTALILRRAPVTVVPMAVDGPGRAWPPTRKFPHLFRKLSVAIGEPIPSEVLLADPDDGLGRLRERIITLQAGLRRRAGT